MTAAVKEKSIIVINFVDSQEPTTVWCYQLPLTDNLAHSHTKIKRIVANKTSIEKSQGSIVSL